MSVLYENREHFCIMCFDNKEDLFTACDHLSRFGISGGALLFEELRSGGDRYLVIGYDECDGVFDGEPLWLVSASEMCSAVYKDKTPFLHYIYEHSRVLIQKNAVNTIANERNIW